MIYEDSVRYTACPSSNSFKSLLPSMEDLESVDPSCVHIGGEPREVESNDND
jgi:hypothetical protein